MNTTTRFALCIAASLAILAPVAVLAETNSPSAATSVADTAIQAEAQRKKRLDEAKDLILDGNPQRAIEIIDEIISEYETQYPEGDTRWYVARDTGETLAYMVSAAASKDDTHKNAVALIVLWADAYYMKGYALVELSAGSGGFKVAKPAPATDPRYLAQAKQAFARGIHLAPYHSAMQAEMGQVYQSENDWDNAYRYYAAAEDTAAFSPKEEQNADLGRAKRGMGFVLIEQGKLDAAETKFNECLKLDPDDAGAKRELTYIAWLRERPKN